MVLRKLLVVVGGAVGAEGATAFGGGDDAEKLRSCDGHRDNEASYSGHSLSPHDGVGSTITTSEAATQGGNARL